MDASVFIRYNQNFSNNKVICSNCLKILLLIPEVTVCKHILLYKQKFTLFISYNYY